MRNRVVLFLFIATLFIDVLSDYYWETTKEFYHIIIV